MEVVNMYEFKDTYSRFKSAVDAATKHPYDTFVGWVLLDKEYRAAALYVTFYSEIVVAWKKNYSMFPYIDESLAVSTVMQYLMKNVMTILDHPKRFSKPYIYKVVYRCIYSLGLVKSSANCFYNRTNSFYEYDEIQASSVDTEGSEFYLSYRLRDAMIDNSDMLELIQNHEIERLLDQIVTEDERFGYLIENLLCNTRMPKGTASCKEHLFNLLKAKLAKYKD